MGSPFLAMCSHMQPDKTLRAWGLTNAQGAPPFSPQRPAILASWASHLGPGLPLPISRGVGLFSLLGTFLDL